MNRIEAKFATLKAENKKAFSPFITAGYPDYKTSLDILKTLADCKVDFIELGMPFSDPVADGQTIEHAGTIALRNGATLAKTMDLVREFRKYNNDIPIIWMGYYNPVYKYGIDAFFACAGDAGVDGVLLADLPPEEAGEVITSANQRDIDVIHLVAPQTPDARLDIILRGAGGFIYFVSVEGITGSKEAQEDAIRNKVLKLQTKTDLPIIVGFGINTPRKAKDICEFADGAIVNLPMVRLSARHLLNAYRSIWMITEISSQVRMRCLRV